MSENPVTQNVAAWRKERRAELLAQRQALDPARRREWSAAIDGNLRTVLAGRAPMVISFYWPFRGEFDARPLMRDLIDGGWRAALPVVVQKKAPLEFRLWTPGAPMVDGIWNIPVPRDGAVVTPQVVLAPVVGFDDSCYRLGYGGGYYDRTLVTLSPRAFAIGIGFAFQHLATIHPQPYDQRLDSIVTEDGIRR
ncbi:MAG TPA: 5-formyltetrahydrofolate cyclo-ligase [Stellaceae bacterium]|nr:5-formyltetrahydrofolate cyclo-ligase [Stellaceae bacterium]